MLTKASFTMSRKIRGNIPLVTRVNDDAWMVRGQLPFPQGLHFIYNAFATKTVADIFAHPYFLEPDYWPEQPSPQFHLTEEMQSCMLVVKGMIHMKDVTTHLDNTMVICRNPKNHAEFGIYNPTHVEEDTMEHMCKLIEQCGVEPESNSASETFKMVASNPNRSQRDSLLQRTKNTMNKIPPLPSPESRQKGKVGGGNNDGEAPRMGTVRAMLEQQRKMKKFTSSSSKNQQQHENEQDENEEDPFQNYISEKKQQQEVGDGERIEGDARIFTDTPWRNLAFRNPEDQIQMSEEMEDDGDNANNSTTTTTTTNEKNEKNETVVKKKKIPKRKKKIGTVSWIVVPSRQTWQALELWRQRFPKATIYFSGNIPAHLTKEGQASGVQAPTAFSLPCGFSPSEPTAPLPEGAQDSGILQSAGGHGAKSSAFNKTAHSGNMLKSAAKWHKPQIDLTRTRIDFYENENFGENENDESESGEISCSSSAENNNSSSSDTDGETIMKRQHSWDRKREALLEKGNNNNNHQQEENENKISLLGLIDEVTATTSNNNKKNKDNNNVDFETKEKELLTENFLDSQEIPQEQIRVPKSEEEINEIDPNVLLSSQQPSSGNSSSPSSSQNYADEANKQAVQNLTHNVVENPTPLDNIKMLPRDGSCFPLFDGHLRLIRVTGDPRTNEYLLYQPDAGMLACTDLYHGSYTDYDPMNTWLVRVWFKFMRDGNFKDQRLLPLFRFNSLKTLARGGIMRMQKFVDELTRGLGGGEGGAKNLKCLVHAHGSGPLISASNLYANNNNNNQQQKQEDSSQKNDNLICDNIRAQYGLVSIEDAERSGLAHPVTFRMLDPNSSDEDDNNNNNVSDSENYEHEQHQIEMAQQRQLYDSNHVGGVGARQSASHLLSGKKGGGDDGFEGRGLSTHHHVTPQGMNAHLLGRRY